jgi:hypothetical protein
MSSDQGPSESRQNFLALFLATIGGGFFLFVLILLTGGLFLYVLLVVGLMALLGLFHYVAWGKMMSEEVAGEREEELLRQRAQGDDPVAHRGKHRR